MRSAQERLRPLTASVAARPGKHAGGHEVGPAVWMHGKGRFACLQPRQRLRRRRFHKAGVYVAKQDEALEIAPAHKGDARRPLAQQRDGSMLDRVILS